MIKPSTLCFIALAALTVLGACDTRGGTPTVVPNGHGSDSELQPEGNFEGESIDELELRLDRLDEKLRAQMAASNRDPSECKELCELSRSICEVKTKMCEIADERVADDEYQNLCRVAKQRCQAANESCVRCVQHHQRASQSGSTTPTPASCEGEAVGEDSSEE